MKRLTVLLGFTLICVIFNSVNAQEMSTDIVIVRVDEMPRGADAGIVTVDPAGVTHITPLEKGMDNNGTNAHAIQAELTKWKAQGFKITHFSTSAASYGDVPTFRSTFILERD